MGVLPPVKITPVKQNSIHQPVVTDQTKGSVRMAKTNAATKAWATRKATSAAKKRSDAAKKGAATKKANKLALDAKRSAAAKKAWATRRAR